MKPQICLNMIVKDEAHIILETLESIKKYIDFWVICDTGSTDKTQELILNYFIKEQIPGELHQHEWKDFGHNRTLALNACKGRGDYIFVFDADDLIQGNLKFPDNMTADSYELKHGINFSYTRKNILKNTLEWKYEGIIHEYISCVSKENFHNELIEGDYYVDSRRLGSRNRDPLKYKKDGDLLANEIEKNPNDKLVSRYCFYAGQSYYDYGDYENAIKYYKKRITYGGWFEDTYLSYLRIAESLNKMYSNKNPTVSDKDVITAYLDAYVFLPERSEPLYNLGLFFESRGENEKAYFYLKQAITKPFPKNHVLAVCKYMYDYACRYALLCVCHTLKKNDETIQLCNELLANPTKTTPVEILNNTQLILQELSSKISVDETDQFDDYIFFPNKDSYGNDIMCYPKNTIKELKEIADRDLNCEGFNTYGYLKHSINSEKSLIGLKNLVHSTDGLYIKKKKINQKIICFFIGYTHDISQDEKNYGSELATICLAEEFAKLHKVYIFGGNITKPVYRNGVFYRNSENIKSFEDGSIFTCDILIISRYIYYFIEYRIKAKKTFVWLHDTYFLAWWNMKMMPSAGKYFVENIAGNIDGVVTLCDWHKRFILGNYNIDDNKMHILGNAIVLPTNTKNVKKIKNRFIWTSSLDRGIEKMIEYFHIIRKNVPDAELYIYRGKEALTDKIVTEINNCKYIHYKGKIDHDELMIEFQKSDIWFYPTHFTETYCISALEAQISKCVCIASDLGALTTTVGDRGILLKDYANKDEVIKTVLDIIRDENKKESYRNKGYEWAKKQTWENRAKEWYEKVGLF